LVVLLRIFLLALVSLTVATAGTLYVRPIQICDNGGANCANSSQTLYQAETNKIWAQAGIDVVFLSWSTTNDTALLNVNTEAEQNALLTGLSTQYTTLWFVQTISYCGGPIGGTVFGCAASPGYGLMISNAVFAFGRLDTIAHELGHNLGLPHTEGFGNPANNLMTTGNFRSVPSTINDIFPDGADLDQLTPAQIAVAQSNPLVIPEPATGILMAGAALGGLLYSRFRNRQRI